MSKEMRSLQQWVDSRENLMTNRGWSKDEYRTVVTFAAEELVKSDYGGVVGRCPKCGGRPVICRRCGRPSNDPEGFCLECHRCTECCERSKSESRE